MTVLIAILILGIIIFIHELGHFTAAKMFNMPVSEFAIGMGPTVYSYVGRNTTYSFRAIPIGGYVNIEGMEIDSKVKNGFNSKPAWQRFIVLVAGVFNNFVLAYFIIFMMLIVGGRYVQNTDAVIGGTIEQTYAAKELKEKDKILEIDGIKVEKWEDIGKAVAQRSSAGDRQLTLVLERNNEKMTLEVPLTEDRERERYYLGVVPEFSREKYSFGEALSQSFKSFTGMIAETYKGLKMLVTGKVKAKEISGPVGIVKVVGDASKEGAGLLLWLTALLSINVGFFNLLPIPALDGGRIIFTLLELIGVKVNKKLEEKFHYFGMILLLGLIVLVTANDLFNLFG